MKALLILFAFFVVVGCESNPEPKPDAAPDAPAKVDAAAKPVADAGAPKAKADAATPKADAAK